MKVYIVKDHPILQNYKHIPVRMCLILQIYYRDLPHGGIFAVINLTEDDLVVLTLCGCIVEVIHENRTSEYLYRVLAHELAQRT